jgi:hypothetical protein
LIRLSGDKVNLTFVCHTPNKMAHVVLRPLLHTTSCTTDKV